MRECFFCRPVFGRGANEMAEEDELEEDGSEVESEIGFGFGFERMFWCDLNLRMEGSGDGGEENTKVSVSSSIR